MLYGGALGNSQAAAAGASGEQMSGEEAEQNELADYSSPYAGLENPNDNRKSLTKGQQSESFTQNIPDMNKTAGAGNDDAMEDEEEPIESSGQSEVVDVQSGHLQRYIDAEREDYNEEMNNEEDWAADQANQQEFIPSPAKADDEEQAAGQQAESGDQAFNSAQDEFTDGQEAPKDKYLEANQVTDTDKEFEAQQDDKREDHDEDQEQVEADEAEEPQLADMNNIATFDDVGGSPAQE
jgi:hypothetical protein